MEVDKFPGSFFGPSTLVELLRHRAEHMPRERAFTFLIDGELDERSITYVELDRQARAIAARLQRMNLQAERALLLFPPGLEYIAALFGCLYAGVTAAPAYPPRLNRSLLRIRSIASDADARVVLTTRGLRRRLKTRLETCLELRSLRWLATDRPSSGIEEHWREPQISSSTMAILQYTSGSTGAPKGVMLSHSNLLHNSALIFHVFEHTRSDTGVCWLPGYHDMGLIGGILQPMFVGRPGVLLSPMAFLQRPIRWLQAISRLGVASSGGPNFAYDLCVRKTTPADREQLDLSQWRVAFNGAEPVRAETMEAFSEAFGPCGFRAESFYPCYGLAEATLLCTGGDVTRPPVVRSIDGRELEKHLVLDVPVDAKGARRIVSCGRNLPDQKVLVVHPRQRVRCPENQVGEIWISGPSVAQGYWNQPEATRRTFQARLADGGKDCYLRTGDMGFLHDGELFVTGRLNDLIIIRGLNHYPQDIELTVANSHPALRRGEGAAFSLEIDGERRLVVVQEIERRQHAASRDAIAAIRRQVDREHELCLDAVVLVRAGAMPKTSSGKIQRHVCRELFVARMLPEIARWPETGSGDQNIGDRSRNASRRHNSNRRLYVHSGSDSSSVKNNLAGSDRPVPSPPARERPPANIGQQAAGELVLEEIRRIAPTRATNVSLDSTLTDVGLDSLERMELQTALESRLGGRIPPQLAPELESLKQVVDAVRRYLGDPSGRTPRVAVGDILPEHYQIERFPECMALWRKGETLDSAGLINPYFHVHDNLADACVRIDGRELVNFSSYDYLGMSSDPRVAAAAKQAIDRYGASVSASRLISGERPLHRELEQALARWVGAEAALVFVSGHATNATTIGHLFGPDDLVLHDAMAHDSILQGCRLSGARRMAFDHNDPEALDSRLRDLRGRYRRVLVAIEGLYSMDGDVPDLPKFIEIKRRHKAILLVDEAHSLGVLGKHGRGIGEHCGVDPGDVDLWMGTLSKALGSCGGYISASRAVVQYLKYTAPGFVYSVGISPANAAAALAALRLLESEPQRVETLRQKAKKFLELARGAGLDTGRSEGWPVIPVIVGNSLNCLRIWQSLFEQGINAQPILHPAVEENAARLRFFITLHHRESQMQDAVKTLAEEMHNPRVSCAMVTTNGWMPESAAQIPLSRKNR